MYGIGYEKSDVKTKRIGSGFKSLTSDSHFPKLQENFEHNLGKYAYRNKNAIAAVDKGLAKMRKVLVTYYKDKYSNIKNQAEREAQICLDAFTNSDDPTSAGQVGKIKYKQLCEIIGSNVPEGDKEINSQIDKQTGMAGASNLREKMTAFYNAAYYKGYEDKNPEKNITNFKNIAQKIAVEGQSELVDELDLDSSILEEQKNTSTDPRKAGIVRALYNSGAAHKAMGFFGKIARFFNKDFNKDEQFCKRMHTQDVYDMGLISLGQKSMGAMMDNIRSGSNLRYRDGKEQEKMQRSLDYYNNMGLDLSEREKNYILETVSTQYLKSHPVPEKNRDETTETFNRRRKEHTIRYAVYMDKVRKKVEPNYTPEESLEKQVYEEFSNDPLLNEEVEKTKSPIKEGIVYKDIPEKGGFLKDTMVDKHNVRIVNGISMTTARMLKTYKWLNLKSDLKNFRLALMGWMLPTDDHSLWEIIIGSHNVGVRGKEDLTDIASLDQTVDPLSTDILRYNVCEEVDGSPKFPHEIVYWNQRHGKDESYEKTVSLGREQEKIYKYINKNQSSLFQNGKEFESAQDFSIYLEKEKINDEKKIMELEKEKDKIKEKCVNFDKIDDKGLCFSDKISATNKENTQNEGSATDKENTQNGDLLTNEEKENLKSLKVRLKEVEQVVVSAANERNFKLIDKSIRDLRKDIDKTYLIKSIDNKNTAIRIQNEINHLAEDKEQKMPGYKQAAINYAMKKKKGYEDLDVNNEEMVKEKAEKVYQEILANKDKQKAKYKVYYYSRNYYEQVKYTVDSCIEGLKEKVNKSHQPEIDAIDKKIRALEDKSNNPQLKYSDPVQKAAVLTYTSELYSSINQVTKLSGMGLLSKAFIGKYVNNSLLDEYFKAVEKNAATIYGHSDDEWEKHKEKISNLKADYKDIKKSGKTSITDDESGEVLTLRTIKEQYKSDLKAEQDRYKEYLGKRKEAKESEHFEKYKSDLLAESSMLYDSLKSVPNKFEGNVYSGTWSWPGRYREGKVTTFSMFTSTSKKLSVAKSFIGGKEGLKGAKKIIGKNALLDIKLNGKGGVDLTAVEQHQRKQKDVINRLEAINSKVKDGTTKQELERKLAELTKMQDPEKGQLLTDAFSMSVHGDSEAEVLCLPGTKIKIKKVTDNVNLSQYEGGAVTNKDKRASNANINQNKGETEADKNENTTNTSGDNQKKQPDKFGLLVECEEI